MNWQTKMGVGSLAAVVGGLGVILGALLGLSTEADAWSIAAATFFGVLIGFGCSLATVGLVQRRRASGSKRTSGRDSE